MSSFSGNLSLCTLVTAKVAAALHPEPLGTACSPLGGTRARHGQGRALWEAAEQVKMLLCLSRVHVFREKVDKALEIFFTIGLQ